MHPTVVRGFVASLLMISAVLAANPSADWPAPPSHQPAVTVGRNDKDATTPIDEDGLRGVVERARAALPGDRLTLAEFVRALQIAMRSDTAGARLPSHEQLVAVDSAGQVVASADGTLTRVTDERLERRLQRNDERLFLVHTHPGGRGLSPADLGQLSKPGVIGMIAVGHDGTVYGASLGKKYVALQLKGPSVKISEFALPGHKSILAFVSLAEREVRRVDVSSLGVDETVFVSHFDHIVSLALAQAGVIDYRGMLAGTRRWSFVRFRDEFMHVVDLAALQVGARMKQRAIER